MKKKRKRIKRKSTSIRQVYKKSGSKLKKYKTYRGKVAFLKRVNPEQAEMLLQEQYKRWSIKRISEEDIKGFSHEYKERFYKRQYQILTGTYEVNRRNNWIRQYVKTLREVGINNHNNESVKVLINRFLKVAKGKDIDKLASELDDLKLLYKVEDDEYYQEKINNSLKMMDIIISSYESKE